MAVDQDGEAVREGQKNILAQNLGKNIQLQKGNFANFAVVVDNFDLVEEKEKLFDGVVLDLGVSSHHLESPERGFSFQKEGPLDMRMDGTGDEEKTASVIVNNYSPRELERVFRDYGEERFARKIANRIVWRRENHPIETTVDLAWIVGGCYPKKMRYGRIHPATRVFQALRIEVNDELSALKKVLESIPLFLKEGGKILVISFHSLEDRIVKHRFKELEREGTFSIKTKRPLRAAPDEVRGNPRSRSAKLRIIKKSENSQTLSNKGSETLPPTV